MESQERNLDPATKAAFNSERILRLPKFTPRRRAAIEYIAAVIFIAAMAYELWFNLFNGS